MTLTLANEAPEVELNGVIEIGAEWNHSCTSQCPNPCPVNQLGVDPDDPDNKPVIPRIPQQPGPGDRN